ncbi:MAG: DNA recombination protein RmuC [Oceanicoccus sp.]
MNLLDDIVLQSEWLLTAAVGFAVAGILISFVVVFRCRRAVAKTEHDNAQNLDEVQQVSLRQFAVVRERNLVLDARIENKEEHVSRLEAQLVEREQQISLLHTSLTEQKETTAILRTELGQHRESAAEKVKTLEQTRQQLGRDFELLANRIFEEKSERFNRNSQSSLDTALSPLREQLKEFKQKVEDVYDKDSKERLSLSAELGQLKQLNQQMSVDALNLTNALKGDNKTQGNWGEVILERVLEESGLHKGREYETQVSLKSEQGRSQPDVIVRLPENKDLIIDSKVSLVHYERYCNSSENDQRQQALKDHVASVKNHIRDLSQKNYEGLDGIRTLDFVLIFIPIEPAFMAAFEHDQAMFREAYEKNIIVVGPTTLLATLRTIQSIWRYERQNKNAEEIARQAGAMHDKFVGFVNDMDKIEEHLSKAAQAHEDALNKLSKGKGNLVGSTQRLEKLGAKVKKSMPPSVADEQIVEQDMAGYE